MNNEQILNKIFLEGRTFYEWEDKCPDLKLLEEAFNLAILGPTSANCQPLRILFIKSKENKERLVPALSPGNIEKTRSAPINAIFAYDEKFYEALPRLFPPVDAKSWYEGNEELARETAKQNSDLQIGYLILALRAVGLDCGPMSGFDNKKCDEIFFMNTNLKSRLICNIGYGNRNKIYPRLPRYKFDEICEIM